MGWKRDWPEREPRPKVLKLTKEQKEEILAVLQKGIESSPVLTALKIRARALRGRFYIEQEWYDDSEKESFFENIGRITPLLKPKGMLLLEVEKSKSNWYEVEKESAQNLIEIIVNDTKGTFHGLGALNKSLCKAGDISRLPVKAHKNLTFTYKQTGEPCSVQEALYHFFGLPIEIIAEPYEWYMYHRVPKIVEFSEDRKSVLVTFTAKDRYNSNFGGTCLYTKIHQDSWGTYTIRPNQSRSIETSIAWLEKRKWKPW